MNKENNTPPVNLKELKTAYEISKIKAGSITDKQVCELMGLNVHHSMITKVLTSKSTSERVLTAIREFVHSHGELSEEQPGALNETVA